VARTAAAMRELVILQMAAARGDAHRHPCRQPVACP
jgi:hypothetical protein